MGFDLDVRLIAVMGMIQSTTHVDVGSDHARLLVALLRSKRIEHGIAIENKQQPLANSRRALAHLSAETRYGDGLAVLEANEADSLSICGMGAESMTGILNAFPDRVPPRIVLQPNRQPERIRQWAICSGYHLVDEQIARGHWPYQIMSFVRARNSTDPAYEEVDRDAALLFGPLILRRREPELVSQLHEEFKYLSGFSQLEPRSIERRDVIERTLLSIG